MDKRWVSDEEWLWNRVMHPATPRLSLHGLNPKDRKKVKELRERIEKQKARAFSDAWASYEMWIRH